MVVTVVADVLGEENNGTTVACMNLIRYLKKCGDTVRVVCCDKDKKGLPGYYIVGTFSLGLVANHIIRKNQVSLARPDRRIVEEAVRGADVVYVLVPFLLGRCALKEAARQGISVAAGFHCQAENLTSHFQLMNCRAANHIVYKEYYRDFYKKVDAVHYPTAFIRDVFEKAVGRRTPAYVISNGVNEIYKKQPAQRPPELDGKFVILFIGRYSREKSHGILIDAVAASRHRDDIRLIFAGKGPRTEEILRRCRRRGIAQPVMEFYSREELVNVINYSDLYCHPAEAEIEAISCLEAIACGKVPLINDSPRSATKAFAADERSLFRCGDRRDLAGKIDYWIEHPEELAKASEGYLAGGKTVYQEHCMEKMREMLLETAAEK